jgi:Dolichyl-phosphate-mannose-protein mannosyltransferase
LVTNFGDRTLEGAVIPPGKEDLLADLLGRGAALPGQCKFAAGSVEDAVVKGTYDCPAGQVVLELRHPAQLPANVQQTDKFAIIVLSGSPPAGLLEGLQSRIRAGEGAFEWTAPPRPAGNAPAQWIAIGEVLFLVLIGGAVLALWRSRSRILTPDATLLILLTALALLLRCIAHGGPADIRAVMGDLRASRAGWVAFTHLAYEFLPPRDETIWNINRIAGALSVPLLYVAMRRRFADPLAALAAAAALAVTPLIVRFSASDAPYVLLCAAFLGAIAAYDRFTESESVGALALALGLLTAAMQLRPEGIWLIVPAALLVLARPLPPWGALRRPAVVACALIFAAVNAVPTAVAVIGHVGGGYLQSFVLVGSLVGSPWAVPAMTPRPLAALVVLGGLAALFYRRPGVLWLAATLVADPIDFPADSPFGHYANARYHIPAMYLACGLAGLGVATSLRLLGRLIWREVPAASLLALGIVVLAAAPRFDLLRRMWTPQREYEFFREGLAHIDPTCQVVTLAYTRDAGFIPFDYLAPQRLVDIREFLADPTGDCLVYYRCANCYSSSLDLAPPDFDIHPACRAIEREFRLEPIVEAQIPVQPYRDETYTREPLPIGFYRLQPLTGAGASAPDGNQRPTGAHTATR